MAHLAFDYIYIRLESGRNRLIMKISVETLVAIVGWLGVIFYIMAYLLLSIGKLTSGNPRFHTLNILGAIGLITDSAYHRDSPNLVVNVVWLLIGIFAVGKPLFTKSAR